MRNNILDSYSLHNLQFTAVLNVRKGFIQNGTVKYMIVKYTTVHIVRKNLLNGQSSLNIEEIPPNAKLLTSAKSVQKRLIDQAY